MWTNKKTIIILLFLVDKIALKSVHAVFLKHPFYPNIKEVMRGNY